MPIITITDDDIGCPGCAKAEAALAKVRKFVVKLSWELELPKASHSEEHEYIAAIRKLRADLEEVRTQLRHAEKDKESADTKGGE